MKKFRVSFSILNSFSKGYEEDAVAMYFKLPREENIYMKEGKKFHKSWENYINKNKRLHPQLSSTTKVLKNPICELKLEMDINDQIQFVGVIDCLDTPIVYEFKSGIKHSSNYATSKQIDVYALLLEEHGYKVDKGIYCHFDQYKKEIDNSIIWITDKRKELAKKWLIDQATKFYQYLVNNDLFDKYKVVEDITSIEESI